MIDWQLNPENQKKYDEIIVKNRQLQAVLGISPKTLAERAEDHAKKKQEQTQLTQLLGKRRPPPKWKV